MRHLAYLLAMVLVVSGCSQKTENGSSAEKQDDPVVLAKLGEDVITADEFIQAYEKIPPTTRPALDSLSAREGFLNDLINKKLLELGSLELFPQLPENQGYRLERYRRMQMTNAFNTALIRDKVSVSEEELSLAYGHKGREVEIEAILLPTLPMAEAMKKRLDEGSSFEDLALEYSILEYEDPDKPGWVGWVSSGTYDWEMEKAVWGAKPGEIVGPYLEKEGDTFFVVRVGESREVSDVAPRDELYPILEQELMKSKYFNRTRAVMDSLMTAFNPRFPDEGKRLMMLKYYWEPPPEMEDDPYAFLNDTRTDPTYSADEAMTVIVEFDKIPDWNAEVFTEKLSWYPTGLWPRGAEVSQLQEVYDRMIKDYLILQAAEDYKLNETETFKEVMTRREQEMRVNYLYHNVITADSDPTEEEIQAWFQENRERYRAPVNYKLGVIAVSDRAHAEEIRAEWMAGAKFGDLREKTLARDDAAEAIGETPW
ncbi:MAG: hypothetical protein HKN21_02465, partial [Candidatus Eisenbacteria bacterium]|nr:hypothetical protein [Candidatus Eisenbacteria bacterium]